MLVRLGLITVIVVVCSIARAELTVEQVGTVYVANGEALADNEITAKAECLKTAKSNLIEHVFGANYKINNSTLVTNKSVAITSKISISSDEIQLVGLKNDANVIPRANKFYSECRVSYAVSEARKELARLDRKRKVLESEKLNKASFANSDPIRFGKVTIRSSVPKAKVFLDSTMWGYSPLEIDRVPIGQHDLIVESDGFVTHRSRIEILIGDHKDLFVQLNKNLATLELVGLPQSSIVFINGINHSQSRTISLEPGSHIVRVEAPNYFPHQDRIELKGGSVVRHTIELRSKPVSVSFISKGEVAQVYLNSKHVGKTPLSLDLQIGGYAVDFITSQGIIDSKAIVVELGKPQTVEATKKITTTKAPFLMPVMVYKDVTLSVARGFSSRDEAPRISPNRSQSVDIELDNPNEGFIYVNEKLAGRQIIQIDNLPAHFTIKAEAPGYYSNEFPLFAITVNDSVEVNGKPCTKNPNKKWYTFHADQRTHSFPLEGQHGSFTFCWDTLDKSRANAESIGDDTLNRQDLKLHLFKKLREASPHATGDGKQCCKSILATLVILGEDDAEDMSASLKRKYPGLNFYKYKSGDGPLYVTHIPDGYGRIPGIIQHTSGPYGYDLKLPDSPTGYSSTIILRNSADFKIADRVIVFRSKYTFGGTDLVKKLKDLKLEDNFTLNSIDFTGRSDRGTASLRKHALEEANRYGQ